MNMKNITMKLKNSLLILLLLIGIAANAQVGIGTASPNAALDIRSSSQAAPANTDGILIPKVDAFPAVNPTASQQGMLVFLNTAVGANAVGFYYWNFPTLTWIGMGASTPGWALTGNAGTVPGTNFLGTMDDKDIVFKRFNVRAGYIGDPVFNSPSPNFYSNNGNTVFGANSFLNPTINSASQQYGVRNTAIGANVMPSIFRGRRNVGIGDTAMFSNTDGSDNTVAGVGALYTNTTGNQNTAIGRNAMTTNLSGGANTAIGTAALKTNSTGANNVAVGLNAGNLSTGSFNVFLGSDAGSAETGSNKLYIDGNSANSTNPLIYGEFDNKKLRVNGELRVTGQVQVNGDPSLPVAVGNNGYTLATTRGTANQVLTTDGAGVTSWTTPAAAVITTVMRAQLNHVPATPTSGDQSLTGTDWQKILFTQTSFDTNTEFSAATSRFTAKTAGYYEVNASYHIRPLPTASPTVEFTIGVRVNGTVYYAESGGPNVATAIIARAVNSTVYLNVNDYVEIYAKSFDTAAKIDSFPGKTYFEVHQIR
jgi:hypothetical protein